jgi:hypothetical protein
LTVTCFLKTKRRRTFVLNILDFSSQGVTLLGA